MYTDCHCNVHVVSAQRKYLFARESFDIKRRQQTMLSFFSTAKKSRRRTGNNNLEIRVNKYYVLFQKQSTEAELTAVSVAVAAPVW